MIDTWIDMYLVEPYALANFTEAQKKLILGGGAAVWGEQVDDINFDSRVFPRVLATAERLWSPMDVNDYKAATPRLEYARCHVLVRRGVGAGPLIPGYCDAVPIPLN